MKRKLITGSALLCSALLVVSGCAFGKKKDGDEQKLSLRNLYFSSWEGTDPYTDFIEEKFGVDIVPASYDYNSWGEQVMGEVNGNNIGDVFHFDLESFNFGNTYKNWAEGGVTKALPDDLSRWPKIKNLINNTSNINSLKIGGKLYGLPLAYNQNDPTKDFSSFTYVYRRDWLKAVDDSHKHGDNTYDAGYPLLNENDEYEWEDFLKIIDEFGKRTDVIEGNSAAIGDVAWGFPSLTNFFKDSPHCYSVKSDGSVQNAFTTDGYKKGLDLTRTIIDKKEYFDQPSNTTNTKAYDNFKGGHLGIYYENLSLSNYSNLRKDIKDLVPGISEEQLDDRTAIMKVKGEDGKYHLEGSENWFSMTFFNNDISDEKQEKILDILDYLLGEEGTKLAIYGKENQDYVIDENGDVELISDNWPKKADGEYATKINGAKYLREMITLNNDTAEMDPFTDQKSYQIIKKWQNEMKTAKANGKLVTFQEPANVKWLSTNLKDENTSGMIKEGNDTAMNYCYGAGGITDWSKYVATLSTAKWTNTIAEINRALGH